MLCLSFTYLCYSGQAEEVKMQCAGSFFEYQTRLKVFWGSQDKYLWEHLDFLCYLGTIHIYIVLSAVYPPHNSQIAHAIRWMIDVLLRKFRQSPRRGQGLMRVLCTPDLRSASAC